MTEKYHFYAGLMRGPRRAFLAGPFPTREDADRWVGKAHEAAERADPWCHFDTPGVFRVPASVCAPGRLNAELGLTTDNHHFVSPPLSVRGIEWRVLVMTEFQKRVIAYEFRRKKTTTWLPQRQWPGYDLTGTYFGLPRQAVKTLSAKHRASLDAALAEP